jgi:hypothetical protein
MRIDRKPPLELAQFLQNLAILLAGTELSAIDPVVRADLLADIGSLPDTIASRHEATAELARQLAAAFSSRNESMALGIAAGRRVRKSLDSANAPKEQWDLCGFDIPEGRRSEYVAEMPTALTVSEFYKGVVKGRFKGNNKSGSVLYEIHRKTGNDGPWVLHMAVGVPSFVDEDVALGVFYGYRVRARSAKNLSMFSNMAVVNPR